MSHTQRNLKRAVGGLALILSQGLLPCPLHGRLLCAQTTTPLAGAAASASQGASQSSSAAQLSLALYVDTAKNVAVSPHLRAVSGECEFTLATPPLHGKAVAAGIGTWTYTYERDFVGYDEFRLKPIAGDCMPHGVRIAISVAETPSRQTYIVDAQHGSNSNPGTRQLPFASIDAAENVTRLGDKVLIRNGTYEETSREGVVVISRSGLPGAFISYAAYPHEHPVLHAATAWNHILVRASYIRVEGLEIAGNARNVTVEDAEKVYQRFIKGNEFRSYGPETSAYQTNGITIRPAKTTGPLDQRFAPRHVEALNNNVHDCQGGGISAEQADYLTVVGNRVTDNSVRTLYATSGISFLGLENTDEESALYKDLIVGNTVERNHTMVEWEHTRAMSDGNGIILDSNRNGGSNIAPYFGRILVANNLVTESGGAGIQAFRSDNIDIFFNTVLRNSATPGLDYGQIWVHAVSKIRVLNNIMVAGPNVRQNEHFKDTEDVLYDYNVYSGGRAPGIFGPHDLLGDPRFVDAAAGNYHLAPDSPALHSGHTGLNVPMDLDGLRRSANRAPSRGAFEE